MDEMKLCPMCGEEILAVAQKCKHCGEYLNGSQKQKNKLSTKQKVTATIAFLIILAIFICTIISYNEYGSAAFPAVIFFGILTTIMLVIFVILKISEIADNTKH